MAKKDLLPGVKLPTPYAPEEEVPGPPQPEEFFPGFVEETRLITQQRFRAGEALSAHGQKSTNVFLNLVPDWLRPLAATGFYPYMAERFIPEELRNALLEENRQEFENLTLAYDVVSWKQTTMFDLPYFMVSGDVADVEDAIREIPPRFDLTDADRAWLQNLFGRLAHLIPAPLPAEYQGTPEDIRRALLEDVLSQPDVEMRAVHNMTVEELEKAFLALYGMAVPEMPEGMTNEQIRKVFAEYEIEDEETEDLQAYVEERKRAWRTESAYTDLLRLGMENAEAPDLNFPQFMKMLFTQPSLASLELLNKYFNLLPRPLAAMAIIAFPRIDPESDAVQLEETYQQYRELGMGAWPAYSRAFQEWDTNIWLKIFIETMFDPTTYIGLGIATKITKPIPHLGKFVGAIERGWIRTADAPFKALLKWKRGLPKIPAVAARHHSRQFFKDSKAYLYRFTNKNLRGVSAAEYQTAKEYAVKQALARPQDIDDYSVMVGRYFLDTDFVDDTIARSWTRQLRVDAEITTQRLVDINDAVEMMFKVKVPPKETAARILNTLAVDVGPKNKNLTGMTKILATFRQSTVDNALRPTVTAGKGIDVLIGDMRQMEALYLRKITSSVYQHAHQAGRVTGWMTRMTDKIVKNNALVWIDRRITAPMANQYLLFTNYGPFNYTENMMRSFLGGGDMLYPRTAHPTYEANRLFSGLKNAPYEIELSMRGIGRLDIAVTMPKTGETMVFHKGKIPFITRKGPLTYNMKIGNKNYPIASAQDWMDMWGDLTTKQRDWDMVVHYKQALRELAPDQTQMLDDIMIKNKPLLSRVKTFSKREASDLERVMWQDATVGPEMIRKHDVPMLEFQRSKTLYDLNKTLDRCTAVRSIQKRAIRDGVLDGSLIKDIDGQIDLIRQAAREFDIVDLQVQSNTLRDLTKRLAKNPPNTADDVLRDLGFISDMTECVSDRISDVRMITRTRAAALTPTEGDTFHRASSEVLQDFLGTSQREIDSMLDNLSSMVRSKKLLKPAQLEAMDSLTDAIKLRNANALSTRELDRRIINEAVSATPPRNRDRAFWDALDAKRSQQAWEPYWVREADLFEAVEDLKNGFMTKLGVDFQTVPSFVPDVAGNLTPAHVAYLLGSTGDDLNRALTKTGAMVTIRPKNKFITYVYAKARKMAANVGKSPDDIGFTKEAIGDVYDQMFRNLGIDPNMAAIEPLTPTMLQLDDVRHELHRLSTTRGIPQEDYMAFKKWIGSVADDLERTPMYAKAPVAAGYVDIGKLKDLGDLPAVKISGSYATGKARAGSDLDILIGLTDTEWARVTPRKPPATLRRILDILPEERLDIKLYRLSNPDELWYFKQGKKGVSGVFLPTKGELSKQLWVGATGVDDAIRKVPTAAPKATGAWWNTKEEAMMKGRELHELAYPTYGDPNFIDSAMRMIYPFWTYESFRWQWLPRTFLRTPGTATALGRYTDYTEQGYIPIPGTDIQFNPLRGTIFMGGFRRLYLRDYPEYYDAFPGMEIIDYIGRLGFYPGTHVMLPIIATGAVMGKPEWGEILPAWARTGLDAARAVAPEKAGKVIEHIFPDRFRDYLTMLTLAELGYDADELWKKRESGIPLTKEEEKLWFRAQNKAVGLKGMLFEQTGVFRIRPPEYTQMMNDMSELIEEMTGVPVEVQEQIRRRYPVTGKRFSDYYKLDALQQKILYEMESYKRWQGVTIPLYPSGWQQQDIRRSQYYEAVDVIFDDSRRKGIFDSEGNLTQPSLQEVTRQWIAGEIGPDQWISMRGKILDGASDAVNEIGTRIYPDVPKTLEEMEEFYKSRGTLPPTKSPDQELLYIYHQLRPEYRWNWDSERFEYDFDTYYAKVDMMIDSLEGEWKQRLLDRIQYDWLPMERLYWTISREYLRPYRLIRNAVLEQYTPEQQKLIMRYEVARGAERQAIMDVIGPDGNKLISGFNSQLREARQRFRILDHELDAWCYFFGVTDTLLSVEATEIYNSLVKEHLTPAAYE